jgi:23S rRNA (guanosine2251-2'-O)-methyltransferase
MNLICGINPVLEALHAQTRHFDRLIVVKGVRNERISEAVARASRLGVPLRFESRETLDRLAGGVPHQGLIAVVSAKPTVDLETLLTRLREPGLLVALDGLEDPRNLGAIVRSCEAAGADGVILPERHSVGLTETVSRASAGALEHVTVARVGNLAQAVEALKERGLWVIGFDASGTGRWDAVDYKRPVALVLGGEGRGIRRLVRERCDEVVSIPLFGHVSSLNVSVAAGIALYEVVRQRGAIPSHVRPIPPGAAPPQRHIEGPAPGDRELDPGATPQAAGGDPTNENGEQDELAQPINVVRHFDEDVAWGRPMEASAVGETRERARNRDERGRPHEQAQERGRPQGQNDANRAAHAGQEDQGRRRRRRRHGRNQPAPPREGSHSGFRPDAAQAPPPASDAHGGPPAGQPNPPRGRRWRRRPGPKPPQ